MYIPKFKQKKPLYTSGGEYAVAATGEEYIGYYTPTTDGRYYSGESATNASQRLAKYEIREIEDSDLYKLHYDDLVEDESVYRLRSTARPQEIVPRALTNTKTFRHFALEVPTQRIFEISKDDYMELNKKTTKYHWPSYKTVQMQWDYYLPVADQQNGSYIIKGSNTRNVEEVRKASTIIPRLSDYLVKKGDLL